MSAPPYGVVYRPLPVITKPQNIVLFGESGVGKSSVINLMAGAEVAATSSKPEGCTLHAKEYTFSLEGTSYHIFDTVGLKESDMGVNTFFGAVEKAHRLIASLHDAGGVDLLLFCIRAGRITPATQRTYRLFFDIMCGGKVPLAIVVTNLEQEDVMEDWWIENQAALRQYGFHSVAHACITSIPQCVAMHAKKRAESLEALRRMLLKVQVRPLRSFVVMDSEAIRKSDLGKWLEEECKLPHNDAQSLAKMLARKRN